MDKNICENCDCCIGNECFYYSNSPKTETSNNKIEPNYYHKGNVDTILFCQENGLDFLQGNIIKYVVRYKDKNGLEDLYKARTYLDRLIEFEEWK